MDANFQLRLALMTKKLLRKEFVEGRSVTRAEWTPVVKGIALCDMVAPDPDVAECVLAKYPPDKGLSPVNIGACNMEIALDVTFVDVGNLTEPFEVTLT